MKYISIKTEKLCALLDRIRKLRLSTEDKVRNQSNFSHRIICQQEALDYLGITREEFKRARYAGQIQYHQDDDKFWFFLPELIEYRKRFLYTNS